MLNQSGLFFVPRRVQSATFMRWLKRIHAWSGFWGALLFLLLGMSGFLLNHRSVLKIDTGEPVELAEVELPVAPGQINDAKSLGKWARSQLRLPVEARPPRGPGNAGGGGRGAGPQRPRQEARFMGGEVEAAEKWVQVFTMPAARVTVDYVPGANHVTAKREETNFLGVLKNIHKGVGLPIAWVLFVDTIAGALVTMSITGFLLWSRMHGPRLLAGALVGGSLTWAIVASAGSFG